MKTVVTDHVRLTVVKHLAAGKQLGWVSVACGVTVEQVRDIGSHHGYPHLDKLRWAVDVLTKKADEDARASIPQGSTTPGSAPRSTTRPPAPPPPHRERPAATPETNTDPTAGLLDAARESSSKRTRQLAVRIIEQLHDLRGRLDDETRKRREADQECARRATEKLVREEAKKEARAEVDRLERELREAKGKLHPRREGSSRSPSAAGPSAAHQSEVLDRHGVRLADVRTWAREQGIDVPVRGARLKREVLDAYDQAHTSDEGVA